MKHVEGQKASALECNTEDGVAPPKHSQERRFAGVELPRLTQLVECLLSLSVARELPFRSRPTSVIGDPPRMSQMRPLRPVRAKDALLESGRFAEWVPCQPRSAL